VVVRFPWGSGLALRCGSVFFSVRPVGRCVQEAVACLRHRRFVSGALLLRSRPFAWSGRRRIGSAISVTSFGRFRFGAPLVRRLFSAEDADRPWTFSDPRSAFTEPTRPLTLSLSLVGTPESVSEPPDVLPRGIFLSIDARLFDLRARGPRFTAPAKARWAIARECLPSSRELASRNPQAKPARTFDRLRMLAHRFAFSPLVPRVRRCFELPSG
jgi:hypothetical protein